MLGISHDPPDAIDNMELHIPPTSSNYTDDGFHRNETAIDEDQMQSRFDGHPISIHSTPIDPVESRLVRDLRAEEERWAMNQTKQLHSEPEYLSSAHSKHTSGYVNHPPSLHPPVHANSHFLPENELPPVQEQPIIISEAERDILPQSHPFAIPQQLKGIHSVDDATQLVGRLMSEVEYFRTLHKELVPIQVALSMNDAFKTIHSALAEARVVIQEGEHHRSTLHSEIENLRAANAVILDNRREIDGFLVTQKTMESANTKLKNQIRDMKHNDSQVSTVLSVCEEALQTSKENNNNLEAARKHLLTELERKEEDVQAHGVLVMETRRALVAAQEAGADLIQEKEQIIGNYKIQIQESELRYSTLNTKMKCSETMISDLRNQMRHMEESIGEREETIAAMRNQLTQQNIELHEQEQSVNELQSEKSLHFKGTSRHIATMGDRMATILAKKNRNAWIHNIYIDMRISGAIRSLQRKLNEKRIRYEADLQSAWTDKDNALNQAAVCKKELAKMKEEHSSKLEVLQNQKNKDMIEERSKLDERAAQLREEYEVMFKTRVQQAEEAEERSRQLVSEANQKVNTMKTDIVTLKMKMGTYSRWKLQSNDLSVELLDIDQNSKRQAVEVLEEREWSGLAMQWNTFVDQLTLTGRFEQAKNKESSTFLRPRKLKIYRSPSVSSSAEPDAMRDQFVDDMANQYQQMIDHLESEKGALVDEKNLLVVEKDAASAEIAASAFAAEALKTQLQSSESRLHNQLQQISSLENNLQSQAEKCDNIAKEFEKRKGRELRHLQFALESLSHKGDLLIQSRRFVTWRNYAHSKKIKILKIKTAKSLAAKIQSRLLEIPFMRWRMWATNTNNGTKVQALELELTKVTHVSKRMLARRSDAAFGRALECDSKLRSVYFKKLHLHSIFASAATAKIQNKKNSISVKKQVLQSGNRSLLLMRYFNKLKEASVVLGAVRSLQPTIGICSNLKEYATSAAAILNDYQESAKEHHEDERRITELTESLSAARLDAAHRQSELHQLEEELSKQKLEIGWKNHRLKLLQETVEGTQYLEEESRARVREMERTARRADEKLKSIKKKQSVSFTTGTARSTSVGRVRSTYYK